MKRAPPVRPEYTPSPPPVIWPWDDRGRSLLTKEKIVEQAAEAMRLYRQAFPRAM